MEFDITRHSCDSLVSKKKKLQKSSASVFLHKQAGVFLVKHAEFQSRKVKGQPAVMYQPSEDAGEKEE